MVDFVYVSYVSIKWGGGDLIIFHLKIREKIILSFSVKHLKGFYHRGCNGNF